MGRIRTIKPEFPQSESITHLSRDARLLFIEMWTLADDEGRCRGASRVLASLLFPADDDAPALIEGWLGELEREGLIVRYRNGRTSYIAVSHWAEHQKIDRPQPSKFPPPPAPGAANPAVSAVEKPDHDDSTNVRRTLDERSTTDLDLGPGRDQEDSPPKPPSLAAEPEPVAAPQTARATRSLRVRREPERFSDFYKRFPRHTGRDAAARAYASALRRGADPAGLLAALERQIAAGLGAGDPRYVPHPASWLNAGRWLDEPAPTLEERCLRAAGLDRDGRAVPGVDAAAAAFAALDDPPPDPPPPRAPQDGAPARRDPDRRSAPGGRPLGSLVLPLLSVASERAA